MMSIYAIDRYVRGDTMSTTTTMGFLSFGIEPTSISKKDPNKQDYHGIEIDLSRDKLHDEFSLSLLRQYYMLKDEKSPQESFARTALAYCAGDLEFAQRIYDYASQLWFMFASPVISNAPAPGQPWKSLPISCYLMHVEDNLKSLIDHTSELRWLSVKGGGVGTNWSAIRSVSEKAPGPIPFLKCVDTDMLAFTQGSTRRASYAAYLDVSHPDIIEFLEMRMPTGGDANRKCMNLHNAVNITDAFMEACIEGRSWDLIDPHDKTVRDTVDARELLQRIIEVRFRTGEPYLQFIDEANRQLPEPLKAKGLKINGSNLCLAGDQRVPTNKGLLTAKELYERQCEDGLIVTDGVKAQKASSMELIHEKAHLYEIKLANGLTHTVTGDHRVVVRTKAKPVETMNIEALKLSVGDLVAIQSNKGVFGPKHMPEEAFLLGLYQGDGTTTPSGNPVICLWEKDFDIENEIVTTMSMMLVKYGLTEYPSTAGGYLHYRQTVEPHFVEANTGTSNVRKRVMQSAALRRSNLGFEKGVVPTWIWESDEETQWQYIRGLFLTDGTYNATKGKGNPSYLSLTSIHRDFLSDLQLILANLGCRFTLAEMRKAGQQLLPDGKGGQKLYNVKTAWRLTAGSKATALKFEEKFRFISRKGKVVEPGIYRDNTKKFYKVVSVNRVDDGPAYCLTVDSTNHVFVANGVITHNCNEIQLATSDERTAVCCLSSLNLELYNEWQHTNIVADLIRFLDNVLQVFIDNCPPEMEKAKYSAMQERSLGLGALGFHAYLQRMNVPFESAMAVMLNKSMFAQIKEQAVAATEKLAVERGSYLDDPNGTRRNAHLLAIAPNANSAIIANSSPSCEPRKSNAYAHRMRAGTHLVKNKYLDNILKERLSPTELDKVWDDIILNQGSVQQLTCLDDYEKQVFKTAFELDQKWVVQHASDRQPYICQGQSVNLFFPSGSDRNYVLAVHLKAWKEKLKGLYYLRTTAGVNVNISQKVERIPLADYAKSEECLACEG